MASYLLVTLIVSDVNQEAGRIFKDVLSFTIGIYAGDPNTITFFQRKFRESDAGDTGGYWLSRLIVSGPLVVICAIVLQDISLMYLIAGAALCYVLPNGRVSAANEMSMLQTYGGFIKLLLCITIIVGIDFLNDIQLTIIICACVASNYLSAIPLHAKKTIRELRNIKLKNKSSVFTDAIFVTKSFFITAPIHLYTSFGGFYLISIKGISALAEYYIADRVVRGLGTTVLALMSKTTTAVSILSMEISRSSFESMFKYIKLYVCFGFFVGLAFSIFTPIFVEFVDFNSSIFDGSSVFLVCLSTAAIYASTIIGTQYLMVRHDFYSIFLSSVCGTFGLIVPMMVTDNPLFWIVSSEISVGVCQLIYFFRLHRLALSRSAS